MTHEVLERKAGMHIAEGYLPPVHAAAWFAVSAPFVVAGVRALTRQVRAEPETKMLLGAAGAFTFVLSALKIPSVTGSCSHPTGTGLGAVLFRPPIMAVLGSIVLVFQAILLAHGGLSTLGANVFSMAIVGPWVAYGAYLLVRRLSGGLGLAVFFAAALGDLATYCVTSLQLAMAFPDAESGIPGALAKFGSIFAVTQIPLAVSEGLLTVLIVRLLTSVSPDELRRLRILPSGPAAKPVTKPAGGTAA